MALKNDPWSDARFGPGKPAPAPGAVNKFHEHADTDTGPMAIHHTLGIKGNQAAAGDHSHDIQNYIAVAWEATTDSVPNATFTDVIAPQVYDPQDMYNDTTGIYTLLKNGVYQASASVYFSVRVGVASHLLLTVTVDEGAGFSEGNGGRWSSTGAVAATGQGASGTLVRPLVAGNRIKFQVYQDGGGACDIHRMNTSVRLLVAT